MYKRQGSNRRKRVGNANPDVNDRPILRAAIEAKADVLLTGDKDFLESGVKNPAIMTPAEFLKFG